VVRLVCGGWVEVRGSGLEDRGGLGDLVAELGRADLGLVLLVASAGVRAGTLLAQAGVGATVLAHPPDSELSADLTAAGLLALAPGEYVVRELGDLRIALVNGEPRDPDGLAARVRAQAAEVDGVVVLVPRTAWRDGPSRADRRVADAAAAAGAGLVVVGPGAPFAGLQRQGQCLIAFGLGALVPPPGVPALGPSALLAVMLDEDGASSFDCLPVLPADAEHAPRLLDAESADPLRREMAAASRQLLGRSSAI